MATINTVVENLTLQFDMIYDKVVFEGSKEELLNRIENGNGLIRFICEGPNHELFELITRCENILSLEFSVEGAGVPVGAKPSPKKKSAGADNIIPFPIRNHVTQPEREKSTMSFQPNNEHWDEIFKRAYKHDVPRIVVSTPEEFMSETGISKEEFFRLISTSDHFNKM